MSETTLQKTQSSEELFFASDDFTRHYIGAAMELMDEEDRNGIDVCAALIHPDSMRGMIADCSEFILRHRADIEASEDYVTEKRAGGGWSAFELAGTDFWLTRCGHGAGFWDSDWPEPHASAMDNTCKEFGEQYLIVGDDGLIHAEGGRTLSSAPVIP